MKMPSYFISHGGGPWPYIQEWDEQYKALRESLEHMPAELPEKPKAILMVSAHWIGPEILIMGNEKPGMYYDYYGFPEHTYHIHYNAPGEPGLAARVQTMLSEAGFETKIDLDRGFDHGAFVPLAVAFPEADIPVVQVSINRNYDPAYHVRMGQALAALRDEGVLIIGSGLSYHNLRLLGPAGKEPSAQFDQWLQTAIIGKTLAERSQALEQWEQAPSARLAHAQEDHLIPLMVAVGAAGDDSATCVYHEKTAFGAITATSFKFG
ncbi:MAG: dioxygenase [Alcaligenaceae bacterium]|nr:dioxygenase [Alcaligenaceae bacterium]